MSLKPPGFCNNGWRWIVAADAQEGAAELLCGTDAQGGAAGLLCATEPAEVGDPAPTSAADGQKAVASKGDLPLSSPELFTNHCPADVPIASVKADCAVDEATLPVVRVREFSEAILWPPGWPNLTCRVAALL